jgi:hypothetical protein
MLHWVAELIVFMTSYERSEMTKLIHQLNDIRQHAGDALDQTSAPNSVLLR